MNVKQHSKVSANGGRGGTSLHKEVPSDLTPLKAIPMKVVAMSTCYRECVWGGA